jgi:hypothetical protein
MTTNSEFARDRMMLSILRSLEGPNHAIKVGQLELTNSFALVRSRMVARHSFNVDTKKDRS